jgi:hypothetical protein
MADRDNRAQDACDAFIDGYSKGEVGWGGVTSFVEGWADREGIPVTDRAKLVAEARRLAETQLTFTSLVRKATGSAKRIAAAVKSAFTGYSSDDLTNGRTYPVTFARAAMFEPVARSRSSVRTSRRAAPRKKTGATRKRGR